MSGISDRSIDIELPDEVRHLHLKEDGFGSDYWLLSERTESATLGLWESSWRNERGKLLLGGQRFDLGRDGLTGDFTMRARGQAGLRASRDGGRIDLRGVDSELDLQFKALGKGAECFEQNRLIGQCAPVDSRSSSLKLKLEHEVPLELAVFAVWLTWLEIQSDELLD